MMDGQMWRWLVLAVILLVCFQVADADHMEITITPTGPCSLSQAVDDINNNFMACTFTTVVSSETDPKILLDFDSTDLVLSSTVTISSSLRLEGVGERERITTSIPTTSFTAFRLDNAASVTFERLEIDGFRTDTTVSEFSHSPHIHATSGEELTLRSCNFMGGAAISDAGNVAGSLLLDGVSNVYIDGCSFSMNSVTSTVAGSDLSGGAIAGQNVGGLFISNSFITGNSATTGSQAIRLSCGTLDMEDCTVTGHDGKIGAISVTATMGVVVDDSTLSGNSAESSGGALSILGATKVDIRCSSASTSFMDNSSSTGDGGAIFSEVIVNLDGCNPGSISFTNNNAAAGNGGAIYAPFVSMTNNFMVFEGNFAGLNGGAIYTEMQFTDMGTSRYDGNNVTSGNGGAVYAAGSFSLSNLLFAGENKALSGLGGAFYHSGPTTPAVLELRNSAMDNLAMSGGVFYGTRDIMFSHFGGIQASNMERNQALDGSGGVIYAGDTITLGCNSNDCSMTKYLNNFALLGDGGVFYGQNVIGDLPGAEFEENGALNGGVIGALKELSVTIGMATGNSATENGGLAYSQGGVVTVTVDGDISAHSAEQGGVAWGTGIVAFTVEGDIFENDCDEELTGSFHGQAVSLTSTKFNGNIMDNEGCLIYATAGCLLSLNEAMVSGNSGTLAFGDAGVTIDANGSTFVNNSATVGSALAMSNAFVTILEAGAITGNTGQFGGLASAKLIEVNNQKGDIMGNTATMSAALFRATGGTTGVDGIFFDTQFPITISDNRCLGCNVGLMEVSGGDLMLLGPISVVDNTMTNAPLFRVKQQGVLTMDLDLMNSDVTGNVGPIGEVDQGELEVRGNLLSGNENLVDERGLFVIGAGYSVNALIEFRGGICSNEVMPGSSGIIIADQTASYSDSIRVDTDGASIGLNTPIDVPLVAPSTVGGGECEINALSIMGSPGMCDVDVKLADPFTITTPGAPLSLPFQAPATVTVNVNDAMGDVTVLLRAPQGYEFIGMDQTVTVNGVASFDIEVVMGQTGEQIDFEAEIPDLCEPIIASVPIVLFDPNAPTPTPTRTPSPMTVSRTPSPVTVSRTPSPSLTSSVSVSGTTSSSASFTAAKSRTATASLSLVVSSTRTPSPTGVIMVPSASPSKSASSILMPSATATASKSSLTAFSATGTPQASQLPIALPPIPSADVPSPRPLPSSQRSSSPSRSRSHLPILPSRGCVTDCVAATAAPVPVTNEDNSFPVIDSSGREVGAVVLPAGTVVDNSEILIGPGTPEAAAAAERLDRGSDIVEVRLTDATGRYEQPIGDIEICLAVEDEDKAEDEGCLSFFDKEKGKWVCEDPCLKRDGDQFCGTTDHLTNFAVLFTGGGGSKCGSGNSGLYIFHEAWQDSLLALGTAGIVLFICCVLLVLFGFVPAFNRVHGREYSRIRTLRQHGSTDYDSAIQAEPV